MFSYRVTEQMASDRLAARRAQADARRCAQRATPGRRHWAVVPVRRRRQAALQPQLRSC